MNRRGKKKDTASVPKRQRAAEARRENEIRFRGLFDHIHSGVAIYEAVENGTDFVFTDVNRAGQRIDQTSRQDVLGRRVTEVFPGVREMGLLEVFQRVWRTGRPEHHPVTLYRDERLAGWREHYVYRLPSGEVVAVYDDVTARKQAEATLRESEEHYRTLVEAAPDVVYVVTADGTLASLSPAFERITGWPRTDWIGKPFLPLIHPDDQALAMETLQQVLRGETPPVYKLRILSKTGDYLVGEFTSTPHIEQGRIVGELGIARDITERRRAEEALRETAQTLEAVVQASPLPIFSVDRERIVRTWNRAAERTFGWGAQEVVGRQYPAIPKEKMDETDALFARALESGLAEVETLRQRKDGSVMDVSISAAPLRDGRGNINGLMAVITDITERKRAQETLRLAEENFRRSLDDSPLGVRIVTAEGETIYANRAILNIYGYDSLEELRRTPLRERYTPESYAQWKIRKEQRERGEPAPSEYEISIVRKNGEVRHVRVFRKEVLWSGARRFQVIYQDITERKRAEKEILSLARFPSENPSPVLRVARDGRLLYANQSSQRLLEHWHCAQAGQSLPEAECGWIAEALERGSGRHQEVTCGEVIYSLQLAPIPEMGYVNIYGRDITERKRAEKALHASQEILRALAAHLQTVREEERLGLARELHDELGQGLTALQIDLAWLDGQLRTAGPAELPALHDKIAAMVPRTERLLETTQTISSSLRPGVLDDLGLVAAIEWLAADFEKRTGLACVATLPPDDIPMDLARAVALFRIVQEAQTNVVRHAKASRVEIRLRATGGELVLEVEDDGQGMAPQQATDPKSLGLLSMRERAAAFGGTIDIRSEAGRGTTLRVRMPMSDE